jgi:hypothetical protein
MNHFSKKYIKGIVGAGGGGGNSPAPPPPPTFKPPKLGDLQAISSYDYVENIDLISDGEIDGLVGQNGEYIDNVRLFEGIYLDDVVVRQHVSSESSTVIASYDLSFIGDAFRNKFYLNSNFIETPASNLGDLQGTDSSGSVSFSVLKTKDEIRDSIYQSVLNIENAYRDMRDADPNGSVLKQLRFLRAQFNFSSLQEVSTYLLPDFPEYSSSDYPFLALKISLNADLLSYNHSIDDLIVLNNDIHNQIYYDLEATELQNKKILSQKKKINITFFQANVFNPLSTTLADNKVFAKGDFYVFFYQRDGFVLKNGVDAVISHINSINVLNTSAKFNYANATFELRDGADLQKPLSLFNKTYLDTSFNSKLRGPFVQGKPILTLLNKEYTLVESKYSQSSTAAQSGLISYSEYGKSGSVLISAQELNQYKSIHTGLFVNEDSFLSNVNNIISQRSVTIGDLTISFKSIQGTGNIIEFTAAIKYEYQSGYGTAGPLYSFNFVDIKITFDKVTKCFRKDISIKNATPAQFGILNTDTVYITNAASDFSKSNELSLSPGAIVPSIGWAATFQLLCRSLLEAAYSNEGSDDNRLANGALESYSNWNRNYVKYLSEPASRITHIVLNPNVDAVFASLQVTSLTDTAQQNMTLLKASGVNQNVDAGTSIPSIIEFKIETGYQSLNGDEEIFVSRLYQVRGLVNSPASIDVGREENSVAIREYSRFILGTENISRPISLPPYEPNKNRFVRVYRVTAESYSSLVRREIYLSKITEIINIPFSYPYSTICGLKLDARTFSAIPSRSYDARFKKVFVPSNYFPLKPSGQDKRYIAGKNLASFNQLSNSSDEKIIYKGNWDGTFKLAWTDNPVWVLFDILINRRYGLGNFVSPSEVNYWELYKIGRYCDAVDSNGVFAGVSSADGGLEPRYAFNGVIADKSNVFDSLKSLIACFRGNMFYTNSEINFTNDRLKPIMAFFNNANVKDGMFNYSNERRDSQYNVIEVSYLDRDDLFKQKIEYVEDTDDIKARGILRTTAQTFGITSRAHAKRLGEHIIYSTINEDENVAFVGGLETLLCRPGDLVAINDEVKTLKRHVGRVLNVDPVTNSIYTNISLKASDFSSSGLTGEISVLIPTGKLQSEDFYNLAKSPSKLNISEIYQTDLPMRVTFQSTGRQVSPSLSYGSNFFIDTGCSGYPLFQDIRVGSPCSITVANTKQQIYKIQSIKELNLNEYEVIASKFDTGKFSEIEKGETGLMQDFFTAFPPARNTNVSEGNSVSLENKFQYELKFPRILTFATGNWNLQFDKIDLSGQWTSVADANSYNVELITPKYRSIKQIVTGTSAIFEDQTEVGRFTLKVTARNTGSYPNPISATSSSTTTVLSYTAPVRNNGIIQGFVISR